MSMVPIPGGKNLFYDTSTKIVYERQENGDFNAINSAGSNHVLAEQPPLPGDGVALTATNASQIISVSGAKQVIFSGVQATLASIRVDFGDSSLTGSDTTDMVVNVGKGAAARVIAVPPGNSFMSYMRDNGEASDVPFSLVRC